MELMGVAEIAALLGVSRQYVNRLSNTPSFPPPAAVLSAGKIWKRDDIETWARETGRIK